MFSVHTTEILPAVLPVQVLWRAATISSNVQHGKGEIGKQTIRSVLLRQEPFAALCDLWKPGLDSSTANTDSKSVPYYYVPRDRGPPCPFLHNTRASFANCSVVLGLTTAADRYWCGGTAGSGPPSSRDCQRVKLHGL